MPVVALTEPPTLLAGSRYQAYRAWLLENFFDHVCSYCLLRHESLDIDHYEPQSYAPARADDPSNLLLGCSRCNGRAGKSDYHPLHAARTKQRRDRTGHLVLDVRADDLAVMYQIDARGRIAARPGNEMARAQWNVTLLKLDLRFCDTARRELLDLLEGCEAALIALDDASLAERERLAAALEKMVPALCRRALLLRVFGVSISPGLTRRLAETSEVLRTG